MNKFLGLSIIALIALTGCASSSDTQSTPHDSTIQTTTPIKTTPIEIETVETTPPPTVEVAKIGENAVNGGIQLNVESAVSAPTVTMNTSTYRSGSGFETYEDVPAQSGGRYIIVKATVTNNGKAPIDLTCSYPIKIQVLNENEQVYTPIDDLYKIQNNPECNASLQPGFSSPMTWAFMVPSQGNILGALFTEVDTVNYGQIDPTLIAFAAGGI